MILECATLAHLKHYLIGNTSQLTACEHWMIWMCKVTSNLMFQINVVKWKYKVEENVNTQV